MNIRIKSSLLESVIFEFKKLFLFYLAILSLLIAGSLAGNNLKLTTFFALSLAGLCGVFLIYGMHSPMNQKSILLQVLQFFNVRNKKFFILVILVFFPVFFHVLTGLSMIILAFITFLGVLYSITFTIDEKSFKLKDFLFVKNSLIGFSWGALVMAGAGEFNNGNVLGITLLTILQVFIGSMIRDLPDIKTDIKNGVNSFPVILGETRSIHFMQFLNLLSLLIFLVVAPSLNMIVLFTAVLIWRFINLMKLGQNNSSKLWLQDLNLFTCGLIFLILFIQYVLANV